MIPAGNITRTRSTRRRRWVKNIWYQISVLGRAGRCFFDTEKRDPDETREGFLIPEKYFAQHSFDGERFD